MAAHKRRETCLANLKPISDEPGCVGAYYTNKKGFSRFLLKIDLESGIIYVPVSGAIVQIHLSEAQRAS